MTLEQERNVSKLWKGVVDSLSKRIGKKCRNHFSVCGSGARVHMCLLLFFVLFCCQLFKLNTEESVAICSIEPWRVLISAHSGFTQLGPDSVAAVAIISCKKLKQSCYLC